MQLKARIQRLEAGSMLTNFPKTFTDTREAPSEGQERLIVELESDYNSPSGETPKVKICFQKWANGIGWFNQKSLYLTLEQAAYLNQEIEQTAVNHKMKSSQSRPIPAAKRSGKTPGDSAIIPFPAGRTAKTQPERLSQSLCEESGATTARILPFRSRQG